MARKAAPVRTRGKTGLRERVSMSSRIAPDQFPEGGRLHVQVYLVQAMSKNSRERKAIDLCLKMMSQKTGKRNKYASPKAFFIEAVFALWEKETGENLNHVSSGISGEEAIQVFGEMYASFQDLGAELEDRLGKIATRLEQIAINPQAGFYSNEDTQLSEVGNPLDLYTESINVEMIE